MRKCSHSFSIFNVFNIFSASTYPGDLMLLSSCKIHWHRNELCHVRYKTNIGQGMLCIWHLWYLAGIQWPLLWCPVWGFHCQVAPWIGLPSVAIFLNLRTGDNRQNLLHHWWNVFLHYQPVVPWWHEHDSKMQILGWVWMEWCCMKCIWCCHCYCLPSCASETHSRVTALPAGHSLSLRRLLELTSDDWQILTW